MLFFLKKLVGSFLLPLPLGLALLVVGLAGIARGRVAAGQRWAWAGVFLLFGFGYLPVSSALVRQLEAPYRVMGAAAQGYGAQTDGAGAVPQVGVVPQAIVVLGGGYHSDPTLPPNFELGSATTVRLVEGVRLWHLQPTARLILSGGGGQAQALAATAAFLGVPRERMELEGDSLDTADEARLLRASLAGKPFWLVTSASHMRRSMALFEAQGLTPLAAPADFIGVAEPFSAHSLWPTSGGLSTADRALHEWIGLLWSALRGN